MKKIILIFLFVLNILAYGQSRYDLDQGKYQRNKKGIIVFNDSLSIKENLSVYNNGEMAVKRHVKSVIDGLYITDTYKEKNFFFNKKTKTIEEKSHGGWASKSEKHFRLLPFVFLILFLVIDLIKYQLLSLSNDEFFFSRDLSLGIATSVRLILIAVIYSRAWWVNDAGIVVQVLGFFVSIGFLRLPMYMFTTTEESCDSRLYAIKERWIILFEIIFLISSLFFLKDWLSITIVVIVTIVHFFLYLLFKRVV